jgi:hypothetical protein
MPRTKNAKGLAKKTESKTTNDNIQFELQNTPPPEAKKRGRKPKGGKLISKDTNEKDNAIIPTNVILHLKCSLKEIDDDVILNKNNLIGDPLNYNACVPPNIKAYDHINDENKFFELQNNISTEESINAYTSQKIINNNNNNNNNSAGVCETDNDTNIKDINMKLKHLKISLYKNIMDENNNF